MKKPIEQMQDQLNWMDTTAHGGNGAKLDVAIGDHEKFPGSYFMQNEQQGLTTASIVKRSGFYRACNAVGVTGKAERPLNIYLKDSDDDSQSWLMQDDLTLEQCLLVAGDRTAMILETSKALKSIKDSKNSHHLFLATTRPINKLERKFCQAALIDIFKFGDQDSSDGQHFGRLAGFKNAKQGRGLPWVNLISATITNRRTDVDKLLARTINGIGFDSFSSCVVTGGYASSVLTLPLSSQGVASTHKPSPVLASPSSDSSSYTTADHSSLGRDTEDANEFGWACGWLKNGYDRVEGIRRLSERATERRRKQPSLYAAKTFQNAARKLNIHI